MSDVAAGVVLTPEEVHRLASKMGADQGKASCHSDNADTDAAKTLQNA